MKFHHQAVEAGMDLYDGSDYQAAMLIRNKLIFYSEPQARCLTGGLSQSLESHLHQCLVGHTISPFRVIDARPTEFNSRSLDIMWTTTGTVPLVIRQSSPRSFDLPELVVLKRRRHPQSTEAPNEQALLWDREFV